MFGTRLYQYGNDPKNTIKLKPAEADAVNKLRLYPVPGTDYYTSNLTRKEMKIYDTAATKLNAYLETHEVHYTEEDEANGLELLTLVE